MSYRLPICVLVVLMLPSCGGDDAGAAAKPPAKPAKIKPAASVVSVPETAQSAAPAPTTDSSRPGSATSSEIKPAEPPDPLAILEERLRAAQETRDAERARVREASPAVAAVANRVELASTAVRQAELTDTGIATARERLASAEVAYFQALGALLVDREDLALAARTRGDVAAERQRLAARRRDIDQSLVGVPPEAEVLRRERVAIGQREAGLLKADQQADALLKPVEQKMRTDQPTLAEAYRLRKEAEQGLSRAYTASPAAALQVQADQIEATSERVLDEAVAGDAAASAAETEYRRLEREVRAATEARAKAAPSSPGR